MVHARMGSAVAAAAVAGGAAARLPPYVPSVPSHFDAESLALSVDQSHVLPPSCAFLVLLVAAAARSRLALGEQHPHD